MTHSILSQIWHVQYGNAQILYTIMMDLWEHLLQKVHIIFEIIRTAGQFRQTWGSYIICYIILYYLSSYIILAPILSQTHMQIHTTTSILLKSQYLYWPPYRSRSLGVHCYFFKLRNKENWYKKNQNSKCLCWVK